MIKAEDFKWLDRVYHLFHLGSYLCLSGALTDCFLPLDRPLVKSAYQKITFLISQPKFMLWVFKRTVSMRMLHNAGVQKGI